MLRAARPVFWEFRTRRVFVAQIPLICTICFIDLEEQKEHARVHFIPDLKVGVFVTLRAPDVIKRFDLMLEQELEVAFKQQVNEIDHNCEDSQSTQEPDGFQEENNDYDCKNQQKQVLNTSLDRHVSRDVIFP